MTDEKLADRVTRLSEELRRAQEQIASCKHSFADPIRATRQYKEPVYSHLEGHGSDPIPVYNWEDRTEHGWSRTCNSCGYIEYTAKSKPIIKEYEPNFGGQ